MSTQRVERVPQLTLGWRLKMALGETTAQEMADYLDVSRQTLSRWMADKGAPPKRPFLIQWALKTSVPVEWLETGREPDQNDPTPGDSLPWYDSNVQPSGYMFSLLSDAA